MFATAALILAEAYESTHNDDYEEANLGVLVTLFLMMAFDLWMVSLL